MTVLSDKAAAKIARGFARAALTGSVVTGVGSASPTTTAVALVGPVNDSERYTATGANTQVTATFVVQADGLPASPKSGDQVIFGGKTYGVVTVATDGIHGVDLVHTLDVEEIGND